MPAQRTPVTRVGVEAGSKRAFAVAIDWPGWARSGKDEAAALAALEAYRERYSAPVREAGLEPPAGELRVVERVAGNATTDFGAPAAVLEADRTPLGAPERARLVALVELAWRVLDQVAAGAPAELRKGPRGGGRDRDAVVEHVDGAEEIYLRKLGRRAKGREAVRAAIREAVTSGEGDPWPVPYAARRIAWHVLDHAWEIEDRS